MKLKPILHIMKNLWLEIADARKVAADIQIKYCGQSLHDHSDLINEMLLDMMKHPKYGNMMLRIYWDDADCVTWVQVYLVDVGEYISSVPR
jgi:hypothetical protein